MHADIVRVSMAQIAPIWLNKSKTIDKIIKYIDQAGSEECNLVTFGEALLPGYPFWIDKTGGATFDSAIQKDFHAHYLKNAIDIKAGDLKSIQQACDKNNIACVLGTIERAHDRGGHSVYCSLVYIDKTGEIKNVHRKLMPTYEERLSWSPGDGHGLRTFPLGPFTLGALNCWENWMPLPRAALYGMGEDLHIALWPGADHNTLDITRFIAKESRSFVISVSGLMRKQDIPIETPHYGLLEENTSEMMSNGASCISGPDGQWIIAPQIGEEGLYIADLDYNEVRRERHNFDPAGHYSRPDVTELQINRTRQSTIKIIGDN